MSFLLGSRDISRWLKTTQTSITTINSQPNTLIERLATRNLQPPLTINSAMAITMANIPDRENLQSMSRTDIQKLCKVLYATSVRYA